MTSENKSYQTPLIDRLGTAEGRTRAVANLLALAEDGDEDEQRTSYAILQKALAENRIQMRRWDVKTWERLDDE